MRPVLQAEGLVHAYAGISTTRGVDLCLPAGARHALIGPNGAGKTTLIHLLSGVRRPAAGHVLLLGADVTRCSLHERARRGMVRTFQINELLVEFTVLESVTLALAERAGLGRRFWKPLAAYGELTDEAAELLDHMGLLDRALERTRALAYGHRRLLEITLALAMRPRLLLLDEPMAGIADRDRQRLIEALEDLPPELAVLLVEHDLDLVFRFARQMSVMVEGAILVQGTPAQVAANEEVQRLYLGGAGA